MKIVRRKSKFRPDRWVWFIADDDGNLISWHFFSKAEAKLAMNPK